MATYQTAPLPGGTLADDRLLGTNSLGQVALLTRVGSATPERLAALRAIAAALPPPPSPLVAGLVEAGTADGAVWVAEAPAPATSLETVLRCAREARLAVPPELAAWFSARLCAAVAAGSAHLRLAASNVFVQPTGEPLIVAGWARALPAPGALEPWLAPWSARDEARADAYSAALIGRALGTLADPGAAEWGPFPTVLRAPLIRAGLDGAPPALTSAALAAELGSTLKRMGKAPCAADFAAFVRRLALPAEASPPTGRITLAPFAVESVEGEPLFEASATIGVDGRIEGRPAPGPIVVVPLAAPIPTELPEDAGSGLELNEAAVAHAFAPIPVETPPAAPARRRGRGALVAIAIVALVVLVGVLAGAGAWLWSSGATLAEVRTKLPASVASMLDGRSGLLRVDSEPSGADVYLGDELLGQTPYVGDNTWPSEELLVRVEKRGFQTATAAFKGGEDARVLIKLRRR